MSDVRYVNPQAMDRLFQLRQAGLLRWRAFGVGATIATYMRKGQPCYASRAAIAHRAGMSIRHVSEAIGELESAGFMTTERRHGKLNEYRLSSTETVPTAPKPLVPEPSRDPYQNRPDTGTRTVPRKKEERRNQEPRASRSGESGNPNGGHVWRMWVDVNREAGRRDPVTVAKDTAAAKNLSKLVVNGEMTTDELRAAMTAYVNNGDQWLANQGHPLSMLPGRLNAYLNGPTDPRVAEAEAAHRRASDWYVQSGIEEAIAAQEAQK